MDWDKFDMNPRVIAAIKKANITSIKDIFHLSGSDLQRLTKLSKTDVQYLLRTISSTLRKNTVFTALQLFQNQAPSTSQGQKLSLGCAVLDGLLRGGIPNTGITEIAGESSAGKTQIALQLCLSVQYPYRYGGLESGAVYICTEDVFPNKRLQQLIEQLPKLRSDVPSEVMQKIKFGNRIFVEHAADLYTSDVRTVCPLKWWTAVKLRDCDQTSLQASRNLYSGDKGTASLPSTRTNADGDIRLDSCPGDWPLSKTLEKTSLDTFHECITKRLSLLLSRGMVRLIIIDSIAALFRCEFSVTDSLLKAKYLQRFGAKLHKLSCRFQTPIICINQVTDTMNERENAVWNTQSCSARTVVPALGITWSNQLLMRLMVCRTVNQALTGGETLYNKSELRILRIIFAPHLPQHFCYYTVNLEGVKGIRKISHDYEET